jgi:anti-sigma factor RsiW
MTCVEFQKRLSAYLDGELPRWTRWKVQLHLGRCTDCAGLLQEFEEVDCAIMSGAEACHQPAYIEDAVMRRLPAMPPVWRRHGGTLRWATGVALAGVQIAAVYGAYWWGFARGNSNLGPDQRARMAAPAVPSPLPANGAERGSAGTPAPFSLWSHPGETGPVPTVVEPAKPVATRPGRRPQRPSLRSPSLTLSGAH